MNEQNYQGVLLLDMVGTFQLFFADEARQLLKFAADNNVKPIVVSDSTREQIIKDLQEIGLEEAEFPEIIESENKKSYAFYNDLSTRFGVTTDRIILLDDDDYKLQTFVAKHGVVCLHFQHMGSRFDPRFQTRQYTGEGEDGFAEPVLGLQGIDNIIATWPPVRGSVAAQITHVKTETQKL